MLVNDDEPQLGERARLAELIQIMGRHGLNGLAARSSRQTSVRPSGSSRCCGTLDLSR